MALKDFDLEGVDDVLKNLNKEIKAIEGRSLKGVTKAGLLVKRESMRLCPVVTSNLKISAYLEWYQPTLFEGPVAEVGYTADYAPDVHENPRAGKTEGYSPSGQEYKPPINPKTGKPSTQKVYSTVGQWKFLEEPLFRLADHILSIIKKNTEFK